MPKEQDMDIKVHSETDTLKTVVLGSAHEFGGTPQLHETYDPWSKHHIQAGTFPEEAELKKCLEDFKIILEKHNVEVLHPENIEGLNQIFMRDIGFVIADKFVIPHIIEERAEEIKGIEYILSKIPDEQKLFMPEDAHVEGGDVIVTEGQLFIGCSNEQDYCKYKVARTNEAGIDFLRQIFTNHIITPIELIKSDHEPRRNVLHLDCCFQPVGAELAILCPTGFKSHDSVEHILDHFGAKNVLHVSHGQMAKLYSNVLSIAPDVVVSDHSFEPLNSELREKGLIVECIDYSPVRKMSGLFRCSTLPLKRE